VESCLHSNFEQISKEIRNQSVVLVELSIFNLNGNLVTERTTTLDISENGCRIATTLPLVEGDVLNIALTEPHDTGLVQLRARWFEVMWVSKKSNPKIVGIKQISGDSLWRL
jgi:hypothetical protein